MTPILLTSPRRYTPASPDLIHAARLIRDAAEALSENSQEESEAIRFLCLADRLTVVIRSPRLSRERLLSASPAVTERSGRNRTLIEMIEAEPEDDNTKFRLAKLLLWTLVWRPETFPARS